MLVRNLALIARSKKLRQGFWPDLFAMQQAEIFLPVDAVIFEVFAALKQHEHLVLADPLNTFDKINTYLKQELGYSNKEMLCWDDLWFWGFINQRSSAGSKARKWGWNPDKYWSIPHTPKSPQATAAIERASEELHRSRAKAPGQTAKPTIISRAAGRRIDHASIFVDRPEAFRSQLHALVTAAEGFLAACGHQSHTESLDGSPGTFPFALVAAHKRPADFPQA